MRRIEGSTWSERSEREESQGSMRRVSRDGNRCGSASAVREDGEFGVKRGVKGGSNGLGE